MVCYSVHESGVYISLKTSIVKEEHGVLNCIIPSVNKYLTEKGIDYNTDSIQEILYSSQGIVEILHYTWHYSEYTDSSPPVPPLMSDVISMNKIIGSSHVRFSEQYFVFALRISNSVIDNSKNTPYLPIMYNRKLNKFYDFDNMHTDGVDKLYSSPSENAQNTDCNVNQRTPNDLPYYFFTNNTNFSYYFLTQFIGIFKIYYNCGIYAMNFFIDSSYNPNIINIQYRVRDYPKFYNIQNKGCINNNCLDNTSEQEIEEQDITLPVPKSFEQHLIDIEKLD
jgi:hypothetical protein